MKKNNKNWNECVAVLNEICNGKGSWVNAKANCSIVREKAKKVAEKHGFTTIEKYDIFIISMQENPLIFS